MRWRVVWALGGYDTEALAHKAVHKRRLADVGVADDIHETGAVVGSDFKLFLFHNYWFLHLGPTVHNDRALNDKTCVRPPLFSGGA